MPFAACSYLYRAFDGDEMNTRASAGRTRRELLDRWSGWSRLTPSVLTLGIAAILLVLGLLNIAIRASSREVDDGVLWVNRAEGVTAFEVAPGTPAARAGIKPGDLLEAIDGQMIDRASDVAEVLRQSKEGRPVEYRVLRLGTSEAFSFRLASVPIGNVGLYFVLAPIGLFTLLVGASVRLRRPSHPATLHFLWLAGAFFGWAVFSFSGRLDRLDWFFYWADVVAVLLLPPLFLHFTFFFPERPRTFVTTPLGSRVWPLVYLPALLLGAARVMAIVRSVQNERFYIDGVVQALDRFEPLYVSIYLCAGLVVIVRAFQEVRTVTAQRQLRWIAWGTALGGLPFAFGYAVPYTFGSTPSLPMELTAIPLSLIPLTFASAIVRYRLADVEVIVKRGMVWAAAIAAVAAIYAVLLQVAGGLFLDRTHEHTSVIAMLATLVVVLVARPLKNLIQTTFDRAFYRDRYDYRRALVGFARDLSADLNLYRLGDRIVTRVTETLIVDRMALLLAEERTGDFAAIRSAGMDGAAVRLARTSPLGARLASGVAVDLDDPSTTHGLAAGDVEEWRERELYYFVPCVSKETTIAVLALGRKAHAEPLNSEDLALLAAVAGQAATALENGRLYRQLHVKAEELGRLREFNESILESLDSGLAVVDAGERVLRWNRALEQLRGITRADALGRTLGELFGPAFVEAVRDARAQSPHGGTCYRFPLDGQAAGGPRALVNITTVPLQSPSGGADTGTVVIVDDVTARAQLEEQLQISDKMASIGLLAAGVAHEVNTPLTGISSFTQMLLEGADPEDPKTRLLEKIERQTFRAAKIVNGLLNLSRPATSAPERAPVDLNVVVGDVLSLLEHQFKVARIQVRREMATPGPVVLGTEFKLQQVFLNLFINARDAMPKGGWLTIRTRVAGGSAVVELSDTGAGIPSDRLARIYDPFFTTKGIGQGTGLGLSITYGIVQEHEGTIACDSAVGVGTRFTLSFPLATVSSIPRAGRAV
jgi:PAS domain S-box-containing protein